MLLATPVSSVPDITDTVISVASPPSPGVTRNSSSPLDEAVPLGAMFQASESGGVFAAPANCAMARR